MAYTATLIDPNTPISGGPTVININFTAIAAEFASIENFLNPSAQTLRMTSLFSSIPAGGAEAASISLSKSSGNAIIIAPSGGTVNYTVDVNGVTTGLKYIATGTGGGDISIFQKSTFNGATINNASSTFNSVVDFRGATTVIQSKYNLITITSSMIGSGATTPLDLSKEDVAIIDCSNGAVGFGGSPYIKLDTTNLKDGQIINIYLAAVNTDGQGLYNGDGLFYYLNTAGSGLTAISPSVHPIFLPSTSPDTQSYIKLQYLNIGGGIYKFVVLESLHVTGVS